MSMARTRLLARELMLIPPSAPALRLALHHLRVAPRLWETKAMVISLDVTVTKNSTCPRQA